MARGLSLKYRKVTHVVLDELHERDKVNHSPPASSRCILDSFGFF